MKKVAVIMNANAIGGAERSLIFQLMSQRENEFKFFIPKITDKKDLQGFLNQSGFFNIEYFNYPLSVYSLSRENLTLNFKVLLEIFNFIRTFKRTINLDGFDTVYLNGNKAAFLFLLQNRFKKFRGSIIWHLRDYYHKSIGTNLVWLFLKKGLSREIFFICNSISVKKSLEYTPWAQSQIDVVYNPVGIKISPRKKSQGIKTLGFVAMMTPWKGLHEIILWSKLFENELKEIGITNIKIYGDDIYKTSANDGNYKTQIVQLYEKLNPSLITFEGRKDPLEIFKEIDCLIHYSLRPEPFGRVILEAFSAEIPVISTCLGGASELVQNGATGAMVYPYDKRGLLLEIQKLILNEKKTLNLIDGGIQKSIEIQKDINIKMANILNAKEAS